MQATRVLPGQDRYENIAQWEFSGRRYAMDGRQYEQVLDAAVTVLFDPRLTLWMPGTLNSPTQWAYCRATSGTERRPNAREILAPVKPAEPQGTALLLRGLATLRWNGSRSRLRQSKVRRAWWRRDFCGRLCR